MKNFDDLVHRHTDVHGRRWYVVAQYRDGCYYAPQRADIAKLTGRSAIEGSLDYVYGNAYTYKRRADALWRARCEFGT